MDTNAARPVARLDRTNCSRCDSPAPDNPAQGYFEADFDSLGIMATAKITALCGTLAGSVYGVLEADQIPGWTELSNLAKASVIGFFCLLMGYVIFALLRAIRDQQRDFVTEVQASRKDAGEAIESVRAADSERYALTHQDMQAACRAMDKVTDKIGSLAVQCAQAQAIARSQISFNRREDLAQDQANRREDKAIAADDKREAAHAKAQEPNT